MVEAAKTDELPQITNPAITAHLYLAIWLKAQRIELAPLTRLSYGQVFRLHINPKLGHWRLKKPLPTQISAASARMDLAPTTALTVHRVFESALADAVRDGTRSSNPAVPAKLPKKTKERKTLPIQGPPS